MKLFFPLLILAPLAASSLPGQTPVKSAAPKKTVKTKTKTQVSGGKIVWRTDINKAFAEAKRRKMPVMLDLYTDWCGWCKELDKSVYPAANIRPLAAKFICVRANPEKDPQADAWRKSLGVHGYPFISFFNSGGKPVLTLPGYAPAPTFEKVMREALSKAHA